MYDVSVEIYIWKDLGKPICKADLIHMLKAHLKGLWKFIVTQNLNTANDYNWKYGYKFSSSKHPICICFRIMTKTKILKIIA